MNTEYWNKHLQNLLSKTPKEDLIHFLLNKSCIDNDFENDLVSYFSDYRKLESKAFYKEKLTTSLFHYVGRKNHQEWKPIEEIEKIAANTLLSISYKIEKERFNSSFYECSALIEMLVEVLFETDDQEDEIGNSLEESIRVLNELSTKKLDEKIRRDLLEFCMSSAIQEKIKSIGLHFPLYQVAAQLITNKEEFTNLLETLDYIQENNGERILLEEIKKTAKNKI